MPLYGQTESTVLRVFPLQLQIPGWIGTDLPFRIPQHSSHSANLMETNVIKNSTVSISLSKKEQTYFEDFFTFKNVVSQ